MRVSAAIERAAEGRASPIGSALRGGEACLTKPEKISLRERKRRIVLKNSFGNVGLRDSTINRTEGQDDAGQR